MIIDITYPIDVVDSMFPAKGTEGTDVHPTGAAKYVAAILLNAHASDVVFRCPDSFAVRYGSNYVATASAGRNSVRFHSDLGDWKEGDDK